MRPQSSTPETASERLGKCIRWATRKQYSAEEKIRIVFEELRREAAIAELCRREGIAERPLLRLVEDVLGRSIVQYQARFAGRSVQVPSNT